MAITIQIKKIHPMMNSLGFRFKIIFFSFLFVHYGLISSCVITDANFQSYVDDWIATNGMNHQCGDAIGDWNISRVTDLSYVFCNSQSRSQCDTSRAGFNGDISQWDISSVTSLKFAFYDQTSFVGDISRWDTSSVIDLDSTFFRAASFNGDISGWDTSSVTTLQGTFGRAYAFNGDISGWDISSVKLLWNTFYFADSFNGDVSQWDTSSVSTLYNTFRGADLFEGKGLEEWEVSSVTRIEDPFENTPSISNCTRRKIFDAWFPQNVGFGDTYGNWKLYECPEKETSSSSDKLMITIGIAAGGAIVLIVIIYLFYRTCCKKKSTLVFYPPSSPQISVRNERQIELDARMATNLDGPVSMASSLSGIKTPTFPI